MTLTLYRQSSPLSVRPEGDLELSFIKIVHPDEYTADSKKAKGILTQTLIEVPDGSKIIENTLELPSKKNVTPNDAYNKAVNNKDGFKIIA